MTRFPQLARLAAALVLIAACLPVEAAAGSCPPRASDLPTQLRDEFAASREVFLAKLSMSDGGSSEAAWFEVLEVFKGSLKAGAVVPARSRRTGSNTLSLSAGTWLVYSDGESFAACSRSRPFAEGDLEVAWLRTGKFPPTPVALRRAKAACRPCVLADVAASLAGVVQSEPGSWDPRHPQPFFALRPSEISRMLIGVEGERTVANGVSSSGRAFELTVVSDSPEDCQGRVERNWCSELVAVDGGWPPLRCAAPQAREVLCDESSSRSDTWGPLESMGGTTCWYGNPARPSCVIPMAVKRRRSDGSPPARGVVPFDAGLSDVPVLWCTHTRGRKPDEFSCRLGSALGAPPAAQPRRP